PANRMNTAAAPRKKNAARARNYTRDDVARRAYFIAEKRHQLGPGSRRYPHFDQDQLAGALRAEGIAYHHFPELGGRRKPGPGSRNTAWRHPAFRAYADHMETAGFAGAVERLAALASGKRTAIMCAEAVWWRCHRSLIADFFKARGWTVIHILDAEKTQEHPFTAARVW
ncbi:MAG: DUF488 domain-containing protein, partial [Verrucomicrobiota bacterium]|nr:DUF488 domain-containing protein [Verrucomicrobiota bacterium]